MIIAIIDDDEAVRDSTGFMLHLHGFETERFASALQFLDAEAKRSSFSFLLTDHLMPHMTGLELLATLRDRGCNVPAALMGALLTAEIHARAVELGACGVFSKPISEDDLVDTIHKYRRPGSITATPLLM